MTVALAGTQNSGGLLILSTARNVAKSLPFQGPSPTWDGVASGSWCSPPRRKACLRGAEPSGRQLEALS